MPVNNLRSSFVYLYMVIFISIFCSIDMFFIFRINYS